MLDVYGSENQSVVVFNVKVHRNKDGECTVYHLSRLPSLPDSEAGTLKVSILVA